MYQVVGNTKTRTLRVLWMLEELGVPYDHMPAAPRSDEVKCVNPAGKVPVLMVEGVPIPDSVAILTFLADRHGQFTFPPGTIERARQDSLTQLVNDEFDQILWVAARHSFVLPVERRVPEVKESLRWEFVRSQANLSARMSETGPFLMGADMTITDILLAHCIRWALNANFPVEDERIKAHAAMMMERPAYLRALEA